MILRLEISSVGESEADKAFLRSLEFAIANLLLSLLRSQSDDIAETSV